LSRLPHSSTLSCRPLRITAIQFSPGRRRSLQWGCNKCWMLPRALSLRPGNSTTVCWDSCTPSYIGQTFHNESSISSVCSYTNAGIIMLFSILLTTAHQFHTNFKHCFPPVSTLFSASVCVRPAVIKSRFHATGSAHTAVGLFLLLVRQSGTRFRRHAGSGVFCGQLQTVTEDVFIFAVLVCSAQKRFAKNALYKFTFDIDIDSDNVVKWYYTVSRQNSRTNNIPLRWMIFQKEQSRTHWLYKHLVEQP